MWSFAGRRRRNWQIIRKAGKLKKHGQGLFFLGGRRVLLGVVVVVVVAQYDQVEAPPSHVAQHPVVIDSHGTEGVIIIVAIIVVIVVVVHSGRRRRRMVVVVVVLLLMMMVWMMMMMTMMMMPVVDSPAAVADAKGPLGIGISPDDGILQVWSPVSAAKDLLLLFLAH